MQFVRIYTVVGLFLVGQSSKRGNYGYIPFFSSSPHLPTTFSHVLHQLSNHYDFSIYATIVLV